MQLRNFKLSKLSMALIGCCACLLPAHSWAQEQSTVNVLKMLERSTMTPATMCFILDSRQNIVNDTQNLLEFVKVSPEPQNGISASIEQNTLCVSGLNPGEHYSLQLKQGLKLTSGKTLAQDVTVPFAISDAQSQIKLPYNMIMPKNNQNRSFAIETLNQSALKLRIYRLSTRSLNNLNLSDLIRGNIRNYTLYSLINENARLIYDKTFDLSSGKAREVTMLSDTGNLADASQQRLELAKPLDAHLKNQPLKTEIQLDEFVDEKDDGIYLVLACDPRIDLDDSANYYDYNTGSMVLTAQLLMFTDIGLTTYQSADGILANVRSLTSGRNMSGVSISLIAANNEVLASGFSDDKGTVKFDKEVVTGTQALRPIALIARTSKDVYSLDLSSSPLYIEGNTGVVKADNDFESFAYTDRGIYRPGEVVHYTALVRDAQLQAFNGPLTLSILNHQGNEIEKTLLNDGKSGGYEYDFKIPQGSALGNYRAVLSLGKKVLENTGFTVGSMVPLQINTEILNEDKMIDVNVPYTLKSHTAFNYGSNAANLQGSFEISRYPDLKPIVTANAALADTLSQFHFGIDVREQSKLSKSDQIYDLRTDVEGMLQHQVTFKPEDYPQKITVNAKVFDTNSQEVSATKTFKLAYKRPLIGVKKLNEDRTTAFALCSYLQDGSTFPQDAKYYLYKEYTDHNFVLENDTWQYVTFKTKKLINQGQVKIDNQDLTKGLIEMQLEDGSYVMEIKSDKSSTTFAFNQGFMSSSEATVPDRIDVFADKALYQDGDTAILSFESPFNGFANLVIGRSGIDSFQTFNVKRGHNELKVKINDEMFPQAHALLSLYAPMTSNAPKVIRVVGTVDLNMDLAPHKLAVKTEAPQEIKPESTLTVKLQATPSSSEEQLKQPYAKLTLVDNGILQLTNFKSPDPNAALAQDRAFNVTMYDAYGYIMRDPMQQGQGYGGSAEKLFAMSEDGSVTTLFNAPIKGTALASKIVPLDKQGQATVDFEIPQFSGSLKVMAVAWDEDKTGAASQDITVHDNAVASLGLPRFMNVGDEAMIRLNLHNLKSSDPNFNMDLFCSGALQCSQQSQASLKPGARSDLYFKVKALEQGEGTITLKVLNNEFNHSQEYTMPVTSPQLPTINTQTYHVGAKESLTLDLSKDFTDVLGVMVNTSVLPNVNPDALIHQVDWSTWGLMDQIASLESKLMYGYKLLEDYQAPADGDTPALRGANAAMFKAKYRSEAELNDAIQTAVDMVSANLSSSSWGYNEFELVYATDVLLQAHDQGFVVNLNALERALEQLRRTSDNFNRNSIATYANAVLSRIESVNPASLRYALDDKKVTQPLQLAYLARALHQIGDSNRASEALEQAVTNILAWQKLEQQLEQTTNEQTRDELEDQIEKFSYSNTNFLHDAYVLLDTCIELGKINQALDLINKLTRLQQKTFYLPGVTMAAMLRANYHVTQTGNDAAPADAAGNNAQAQASAQAPATAATAANTGAPNATTGAGAAAGTNAANESAAGTQPADAAGAANAAATGDTVTANTAAVPAGQNADGTAAGAAGSAGATGANGAAANAAPAQTANATAEAAPADAQSVPAQIIQPAQKKGNDQVEFFDGEQIKAPLKLTNAFDKPMFKTVSVLGMLKRDKIQNQGISVRINYFNKSDRIDPEKYQFRLNEEVLMEVNVNQTKSYSSDSIVKVKLPAGFEFVRSSTPNDPTFGQLLNNVRTGYTNVDAGDDIAVAKFSRYDQSPRSIFLVLRAALPGTYAQGEALVQMQQAPNIFGTYHSDTKLHIQSDKNDN